MKKRYYKDVTIRIELSSVDNEYLNKVCQNIVEDINTSAIKVVNKFSKKTLVKKGEDITIDNITTTVFPKK